MSSQKTLPASNDAISSPGSAAGNSPSNLQAGQKAKKSGRAPVPASLFPLPERVKVKPMSDTFGPNSSVSLRSADLQSCLENKLRTQLATGGLMEYSQTWKARTTPAERSYWEHTASGRRTPRQRLWWVAESRGFRSSGRGGINRDQEGKGRGRIGSSISSEAGGLGDTEHHRREGWEPSGGWSDSIVPSGYWSDFDVIECSDGKSRRIPPIESGIFPLADGVPNRVGRLRGYGNAIVPQVAAMFIRAFMETIDLR